MKHLMSLKIAQELEMNCLNRKVNYGLTLQSSISYGIKDHTAKMIDFCGESLSVMSRGVRRSALIRDRNGRFQDRNQGLGSNQILIHKDYALRLMGLKEFDSVRIAFYEPDS